MGQCQGGQQESTGQRGLCIQEKGAGDLGRAAGCRGQRPQGQRVLLGHAQGRWGDPGDSAGRPGLHSRGAGPQGGVASEGQAGGCRPTDAVAWVRPEQ